MPELLGFEIRDEKVLALVNFPGARKFTLLPGASAPVVTPQPRTARYDIEGVRLQTIQCRENNKDPGFWAMAEEMTSERQQRLDHIRTHGASDVLSIFMQAAYQSAPAEQIFVPGPAAPRHDNGMKH